MWNFSCTNESANEKHEITQECVDIDCFRLGGLLCLNDVDLHRVYVEQVGVVYVHISVCVPLLGMGLPMFRISVFYFV